MCDVNRRDALARSPVGHDLRHRIAGIRKVSGLVNCKLFRLIFCSRLSAQRLTSLWFLTVAYHLARQSTVRLSAHKVFSLIFNLGTNSDYFLVGLN